MKHLVTFQPDVHSAPEARNEEACALESCESMRRLYRPDELPTILSLSSDQVASLEATGQITPILICGQKRFLSQEIDGLINTYLHVAKRKNEHGKRF